MATYKVIQDIEAEDKLVGPFSLRQFIYGVIALFCGYLSFLSVSKHVAVLLVLFMPISLFTGFFAIPWEREQPTEIWALAKIRFFLKPRRRIWNQSGVKNLVNVTAPRRVESSYSTNLSQTEVHSRLAALANTLDSRGWAIKNVNTNLYDPTAQAVVSDSDRLIGPSSIPQEVSTVDVTAQDDILDPLNNPIAQKLEKMVTQSSSLHRQQLVDRLSKLRENNPITTNPQLPEVADYWFLNQPLEPPKVSKGKMAFTDSKVIAPGSEPTEDVSTAGDDEGLSEKLKKQRAKSPQTFMHHLKTISPLSAKPVKKADVNTTTSMTPPTSSDKMRLANSNDLSVAAIAHLANQEEVVVPLRLRTP